MLAETLHATADTGNELLLLGMKRSSRPPDEFDPYGHGKALYFCSLLVAVSIFDKMHNDSCSEPFLTSTLLAA